MNIQEFHAQFEMEARRLRLNMYRLPGLAASGAGWEETLLARMRGLAPGATWADVLPDSKLGAPDPRIAGALAAADADPEGYWRRLELTRELSKELRRLVTLSDTDSVKSGGFGFDLPDDPEYTLQQLRMLPDGAGWGAFQSAMRQRRPTP